MSQVLTRQRNGAVVTLPRAARNAAAFLVVLMAMLGLTSAPASALTQAEMDQNRVQLCHMWFESPSNPSVEVANGLRVSGTRLQRRGASCMAAGAEVRITDPQIEDATAAPAATATARLLAAVTHAATSGEIAQGSELFKSASISRMYVGFDWNTGFYVAGELRLAWSGGTNTYFAFRGSISGLDRFDFRITAPAAGTQLPNIGGRIYGLGTLKLRGSRYSFDFNGGSDELVVGEGDKKLTVTDATFKLKLNDEADGSQRLGMTVTGKIAYGPDVTVDGTLSLDFDDAGVSKVSGSGTLGLNIPAKGSSPAGSVTGSATIAYDRGSDPLITFDGEARFGEAVIVGAKGTVDLDAVNFTGDATVKYNDILFKGDVEGVVFIGLDLTGRTIADRAGNQVQAQNSDWLIKSATATVTAKGLALTGVAQVGDVGTERWVKGSGSVDMTFTAPGIPETTVKGKASADWLEGAQPNVDFEGSIESGSTLVANAKGAVDGKKIDFSGDVTLSNPDLKITGAVDGTVFYGSDLAGATIKNRAGADVEASKGDFFLKTLKASVNTKGFAVTGAASLGRVGADRWAKAGGTVDVTYGGTKLTGSADVDWVSPNIPTVTFKGSVASGEAAVASAEGTVDGSKLTVKGTGKLTVAGFTIDGAAEGVVYYGTDLTGQKITDRSGAEVQAKQGDFLIKATQADVIAKGFTLKGAATIGRVGGVLWAKGGGNVDLTYGATNLKGSVNADWTAGGPITVGFAGTVTSGATVVAGASGTFDGKKITIKGNASFTDPKLTLSGSVEGVVYYGDDLTGETIANRAGTQVPAKKGDFLLKSATGDVAIKNLKLTGSISLSSVGGVMWATGGGAVDLTYGVTTIKGTASLAWAAGETPTVAFTGAVSSSDVEVGTVKGTIDGNKITFTGEAKMTNAVLSATGSVVEGVVFYGSDLTGETVTNRAGVKVPAVKGDLYLKLAASADLNTQGFKLTGAAQIGSTSGEKWVKGGGAVDFTAGTTVVKGSATVEWIVGKSPAVAFEGSVAQGGLTLASAKGTIDDKKLKLTGDAALVVPGYSTKGAVSATVWFGNDLTGETVTNRAGDQVPATKGDLYIDSVKAEIIAKSFTLMGEASIGYVGGKLFAEGSGAVEFTAGTTNVKGMGTASWALGEQPVVAFAGTVTQGTTAVANAVGLFDGKKLAIKGDASLTDPKFTITGSVEGVVYYATDLTGETVVNKAGVEVQAKKGDFVLSDASTKITVKNLELTGKLTLASVGGVMWATVGGTVDLTYGPTNIKGSATLNWEPGIEPVVSFEGVLTSTGIEVGSVKGTVDGNKLVFTGKAAASISGVTLDGTASGAVYYGPNLSAEKIKNHAGVDVTPAKGDFVINADATAKLVAQGFTLTGKAGFSSVGTERWLTGGGTVDVVYGTIAVKGTASVDWTIGTPFPAIPFTGSVKSSDVEIATVKGSITDKVIDFTGTAGISNAQLALTGAVEGKLYYAADQTGQKVKNYAGVEIQAKKNDLFIKSASAKVDAKGFTLTGAVEVGLVGTEKWVKGGGSVDVTFGTTKLKGAATVDYLFGGIAKVAFDGSLTNGTTVVANASGSVDGKKIAIKGDVALTDPSFSLKGAAEGTLYYGSDLTGETVKNRAGTSVPATKGDFVLTSATGEVTVKSLVLKGAATFSSVGTEKWATGTGAVDLTYNGIRLKGSATASWVVGQTPTVAFEGTVTSGDTEIANAKGTLDGKKIVLEAGAAAKLTNPALTLAGDVKGTIYYGLDQSGNTVQNRAGDQVAAKQGDWFIESVSATVATTGFTLVGGAELGSVSGEKWVTGGGAVDFTTGATSIKGAAVVDWVVGKAPAIQFEGSVSQADVQIAGVKGTLDDKKLTLTGDASLSVSGLAIKGGVSGVVYFGSDLSGLTVKNAAGVSVPATKGDIVLDAVTADITANGFVLKGKASINYIGGKLFAEGAGSVDLTYGATNVKGSATAKWAAGGTPSVSFDGTLTNGTTIVAGASGTFDGQKLALKGNVALTDPSFSLKGAAEGTLYYGNNLTGLMVKNRAGADVQATKGDFVLTSASGEVLVKNLTLTGAASFSSVGTEKWATGGGSVDLTYNGINLKGSATATWVVGQAPSVAFEGTITSGGTTVAGAKGTLDGKKITLTAAAQGNATISNTSLALKGDVAGTFYYGADQTGETVKNKAGTAVQAKQGDFLIDSASATVTVKGLTLVGKATIGSVSGQKWVTGGGSVDFTYNGTNVKGSATVDWVIGSEPVVTFEGTVAQGGVTFAGVKGALTSTKLTFTAGVQLTASGIGVKGQVSGAVYLGADLTGEKIRNAAGTDVTPARGDIYVDAALAEITAKNVVFTAAARLGFVGGKLWVEGGGSVDLTYGTTKLVGTASVSWAQGGTPSVAFAGSVTNGTTVVANAAGILDGKKIAIKGDAAITDPRFTLKGAVEGIVFYGADQTGELIEDRDGNDVQPVKGDFKITSASGEVVAKGLTVKGQVSFTSIGTVKWATGSGSVDFTASGYTLKGSADIDWLMGQTPTVKFTGSFTSGDTQMASVSGELDGKKLALSGAVKVTNPSLALAGDASGVVHYAADQTGETIKNKAGTAVAAKQGDFVLTSASAKVDAKGFSLTGAASLGSVGTQKWVTGGGSIDLTYGTVNVKGTATVDWIVGQIPTLAFEGALKSADVEVASAKGTLDDKKITFSGTAKVANASLTATGSVTGGVLYYGNSLTGSMIKNKAGVDVQATKGDLRIDSAAADVTVKNLTFKANIQIGLVGAEKWVKGTGSVDAVFGTTTLKGSADFDWLIGQTPSVAFTGSLTNGTAVVANAAGILDGKKIAIKGDVTATQPNMVIKGAVEGVFFYGTDLTGELVANRAGTKVQPLKGDYLLTNASGSVEAKGLALSGGISVGNVRGDWWATAGGAIDMSFGQPVTRIQGSATLKADGNVAFEGKVTNADTTATISGTADGKKITFTGDLSNPMLSGKATGVIYYGASLTGETIVNRAGATVAATRGDFKIDVADGSLVLKQLTVANAQASLVKAGTAIWIKGGGKIKLGDTWINFSGEADSTGYANLGGSGTVVFDGTTVDFAGSATIKDNRLVIGGTAKVTNGMFSVTLSGTIEKPDMAVSQYYFTGTANFKFGTFSVANATVRLVFGEGLTTVFSIKSCFLIFICPNATYKLYFYGGKVARAELEAPIAWVAQFLAIGAIAMPGAQIDTKITGLI